MEKDINRVEDLIFEMRTMGLTKETLEDAHALENLIKGYRELETNINGYQEEITYQSKTIIELEEQIKYYANEINEIANELEKDGFVGYADEIRDLCIIQDELMEDK